MIAYITRQGHQYSGKMSHTLAYHGIARVAAASTMADMAAPMPNVANCAAKRVQMAIRNSHKTASEDRGINK